MTAVSIVTGFGFGVPGNGSTLSNVTVFAFGRNDSFGGPPADVDAAAPFDRALRPVKK